MAEWHYKLEILYISGDRYVFWALLLDQANE